jgi:serine/threonine protein kinase
MPFAIGDSIGPYKITEQLGQGGMATVYKAYHASLDRFVAIKVLHPNLNQDDTFTARFKREARLIARLDHPNIVQVHDFAEQDHYPYLVMKFIEGQTLKDRLRRGPLTSQEIRDVLESVGSALEYAHQQGILHRDVKPSNVLIASDGRPYLADFGLARITEDGESTLSSDSIVGTPQYISPEQALGKKELDEGTDIYSFGVMLYEMVVGKVPFDADTPFSVIFDHIYTPLPLPRTVNPAVPPGVERVLLKALAKERANRYTTVSDLVAAFESAWDEAGVPMQGTAIMLRGETGKFSSGGTLRETGSSRGARKALPSRGNRPFWWLAGGGVLLLACCVVAASALGLLNLVRPLSTSTPSSTPTRIPTATPTPLSICNGEQTWLLRDYFPEQEIAHCREKEHSLTALAYSGSEWVVVLSRGIGYTDQVYFSAPDFPETTIREYWDGGYDITSMDYGGDAWYVVMSKGAGFTNQIYLAETDIPNTEIQKYWDQEYSITSLAYGDGTWVAVMSQGTALGVQVYFTGVDFPEDKIRNYWDTGYDITSAAFSDSAWVIVMSTGSQLSNQYYYRKDIFPEEGIAEDWDNGFSITNVDFGNALWFVVMSKP